LSHGGFSHRQQLDLPRDRGKSVAKGRREVVTIHFNEYANSIVFLLKNY